MSRRVHTEILDESLRLTLRETCRICGVHAEFLMELVDEGVITPREETPPADGSTRRPAARRGGPHLWRFDGVAVVRVQRALRLQQDLGVNLPGVALALELLDELEKLRGGGPA